MELKDFIKATITGIVSAVNDLNGELQDLGAIVNPHQATFQGDINKMVYNPKGELPSLIHEVEFNLAITEMKQTKADGGLKIKVLDAGVGKIAGIENTNTVKFSIPVVYSTK